MTFQSSHQTVFLKKKFECCSCIILFQLLLNYYIYPSYLFISNNDGIGIVQPMKLGCINTYIYIYTYIYILNISIHYIHILIHSLHIVGVYHRVSIPVFPIMYYSQMFPVYIDWLPSCHLRCEEATSLLVDHIPKGKPLVFDICLSLNQRNLCTRIKSLKSHELP